PAAWEAVHVVHGSGVDVAGAIDHHRAVHHARQEQSAVSPNQHLAACELVEGVHAYNVSRADAIDGNRTIHRVHKGQPLLTLDQRSAAWEVAQDDCPLGMVVAGIGIDSD